jgi:hypothetical protein
MLSYWPEHQARLERCRLLMRNIGNEEEMAIDTIVYSLIWIMVTQNQGKSALLGLYVSWSKSLE